MTRVLPDGSAYHPAKPSYDAELTRVERGTPMGELLRRYWHPVGLSSDAGRRPKPVRMLGEDLILFRDGAGRAGLVYPRCCHRGTGVIMLRKLLRTEVRRVADGGDPAGTSHKPETGRVASNAGNWFRDKDSAQLTRAG